MRLHPSGTVFKLLCESTWGDIHYLGLNGVEILSPDGRCLDLSSATITADPLGVCVLPGMARDARTVDQLLLGCESTCGWLAPYTPGTSCEVTIRLPGPITIGAVRLYNYAKTPARGVKDFQLILDGSIIFGGVLRAAPLRRPTATLESQVEFVQSVLFTDNEVRFRIACGASLQRAPSVPSPCVTSMSSEAVVPHSPSRP